VYQSLYWGGTLLAACGLGIVVALVHYFAFGLWLCPQQANNLRYRLEGTTLRVDGGVFFLVRKSIPLERITDIALVQGPLLRYFGIWAMRIQTAGSAQCEATLYGVRNPEEVRESILSQRQRIDGEKAADA
jgi:membrane protein YdbS with pleckstrin-like domain